MDRVEPGVAHWQAGEERNRNRVLSRDEVRELWPALLETEAKNPDGTLKPRLSQALNDWTIPSESSKNADPHRVPLTPMVKDILERRARDGDDLYVFSTIVTPVGWIARKRRASILCNGGVSFQFRAHDLRRTAASYMGEAGVDRFHTPTC